MEILVTGGAGFIGSHLVRELIGRGDRVVVLDSLDEQVHGGIPPNLPEGVELIVGNVGDADAIDRALEGIDHIVHLAAVVGVGQSMYDIERYVRENTLATATFLERVVAQSERPKRLVVASSMSIYGEGEYECATHGAVACQQRSVEQLAARDWEPRCSVCGDSVVGIGTSEGKQLQPTSVYAVTKRDHEELALAVGNAYGIPTVALRFFNVFGPGQSLSNPYTGVAAIFASRLLNRNPPLIFEDGNQSRDFIHVSDIANGILLALESEDAVGHAINLGTGRPTSVRRVAEVLSLELGVDVQPTLTGEFRAGDIRHCFASTAIARARLGFEAKTSFEEGMRQLARWLDGQKAVDRVDDARRQLVERHLTL